MSKKILVTGATGFVGEHVLLELLKRDYTITASSSSLLKASDKEWFGKVKFIPFDLNEINDSTNYYQYFGNPDALIHLAWEGLPNYKDDFHITKNLPGQKSFLQNMIKNGLKDLTVTGTCFEYGMKDGCLAEDMECEPANPYAVAKNELRKQLEEICISYQCSLKWVRLFYMYGKGQSPKSLISQLDKALENGDAVFNMSGGEQVRDFLPVEKVAAYLVTIAVQQIVTGVINCCSGQPVSVKDFVKAYLETKDKSIHLLLGAYPYPDYEPMNFWGETGKLNSALNNK